ncbi:MAG: hypothetical protein RIB84_27505 [Sneathiellaceae bacterium]
MSYEMTWLEFVICLVIYAWLVLTVVAQFFKKFTISRDPFSIIPICNFFAPRPVRNDVDICYRTFDRANAPTPWRPLYRNLKPWYAFLFNPEQRLRKLALELHRTLAAAPRPGRRASDGYVYRLFLNAVAARASEDPGSVAVEFVVYTYRGYEGGDRSIVFKSDRHDV